MGLNSLKAGIIVFCQKPNNEEFGFTHPQSAFHSNLLRREDQK